MNTIKLAVFGDSFADHFPMLSADDNSWQHRGWPGLVASSISDNRDDFIFKGRSGTSVWHAYTDFLNAVEHHELERVVFSYTSPQRIPHLPEELAGESWKLVIPDDPVLEFDSEDDKYLTYVKYFYNDQLHKFIAGEVFRRVNIYCADNNIRLVNVLPFPDCECYSISDAEFSVLHSLYDVCKQECGNPNSYLDTTSGWLPSGVDQRLNHMNDNNNEVIAREIVRLLDQRFTKQVVNSSTLNGLDFSAETWQQYNSISYHNN